MKTNNLLGIDLGTTGLKAVIYDNGKAIGQGYCTYPIDTPKPGFAEQDPDEWVKAMSRAVKQAVTEAETGAGSAEIKAVGFSGQMHGTVMLDESGSLLCPAIIWCDTRSGSQRDYINKNIGEDYFYSITQNNAACGFQALSLLWVKENRPEVYKRIKYVISPKDYLRKQLCGSIGCDITDATATLLYDNINNRWSHELISALGLEISFFPKAAYPYEIAGCINKNGAELTGLAENTAVAYGGGDQPMQAAANGITEPGDMSLVIGTGGQIFYAADINNQGGSRAVNTFYHALPGMKYFLAATLGACLSFNWFCEKIIGDSDYKTQDEAASKIEAGCGGVIFLPHLTGERTPFMNPNARGIFWGLSIETDKACLYRAVMEGVAYSLAAALEELEKQVIIPDKIISAGGAFNSPLWAQICADVLGRSLYVTAIPEPSAAGAAICAGVGSGVFKSLKEGSEAFNKDNSYKIYTPNPDNAEIYKRGLEKYMKLYRQNNNFQEDLKC
jgi:xylulokinase